MYDIQLSALATIKRSDILGAIASSLCLIHCLATPFIFIAQAGAVGHHHHHGEAAPLWWHSVDFIFLVISFLAVYYSALNTRLKWMPIALYVSWGLLALFILNEKFHLLHLDHIFILVPAISLVGLHLYNRKYCGCDDEECCVPEDLVE